MFSIKTWNLINHLQYIWLLYLQQWREESKWECKQCRREQRETIISTDRVYYHFNLSAHMDTQSQMEKATLHKNASSHMSMPTHNTMYVNCLFLLQWKTEKHNNSDHQHRLTAQCNSSYNQETSVDTFKCSWVQIPKSMVSYAPNKTHIHTYCYHGNNLKNWTDT